ncbi:MAG TPA: cupin domain-containing protein [Paenibacillus sp.]|nr:cupin domain-containing protein [Paenibacillus sp.]
MKAFARRDASNTYFSLGTRATFLLQGEDTGNRFSLIEFLLVKGADTPPHTHLNEDEHYYVLEGDITVQVGDETIRATPGTYVYLPRDVRHSYRVESDQAKLLVGIFPAGFEQFFLANGAPVDPDAIPPAPQGPPSDEQIRAMVEEAAKYGIVF